MNRAADALLGVVYLTIAAAVFVAAALTYNKTFVERVDVQLHTGAVGNALQKGSDVKLRGVPVGQVKSIESAATGTIVTLALDPAKAEQIPGDTTARLLPKTLFGERYVALQVPASADVSVAVPAGLRSGDTIAQDRSDKAVELEEVFGKLLPVLQAVQPQKISAALSEFATMLRGEGGNIGTVMSQWRAYLEKLTPLVPAMSDDLAALARVARHYDAAAPDLLSALDSMTVTSLTLAEQQKKLGDVFRTGSKAADTTGGWLSDNEGNINALSGESRRALGAAAPYATGFPCLFRSFASFIPWMNKALGEGTDQPGLHAVVTIIPKKDKYVFGMDTPVYGLGGAARCPNKDGSTRPAGGTR